MGIITRSPMLLTSTAASATFCVTRADYVNSEAVAMALKKEVEKNGGVSPQIIVTDNGTASVNLIYGR
jgi:transposase InsO family protein